MMTFNNSMPAEKVNAPRDRERGYLPAAGRDWALPLYDPLVKLLGGDRLRSRLVEQAAIAPGHRILDVGCGTGTLAVYIQQHFPSAVVAGLDPDPKALARAKRKAQRAAAPVRFERGFSDALPYANASFDRVFSSFMLHHVPAAQRETTLREMRRVLAPGGSLHLLDFEARERQTGGWLAHVHSSGHLYTAQRLLAIMREAGFARAKKTAESKLLFGLLTVGYYRADS